MTCQTPIQRSSRFHVFAQRKPPLTLSCSNHTYACWSTACMNSSPLYRRSITCQRATRDCTCPPHPSWVCLTCTLPTTPTQPRPEAYLPVQEPSQTMTTWPVSMATSCLAHCLLQTTSALGPEDCMFVLLAEEMSPSSCASSRMHWDWTTQQQQRCT